MQDTSKHFLQAARTTHVVKGDRNMCLTGLAPSGSDTGTCSVHCGHRHMHSMLAEPDAERHAVVAAGQSRPDPSTQLRQSPKFWPTRSLELLQERLAKQRSTRCLACHTCRTLLCCLQKGTRCATQGVHWQPKVQHMYTLQLLVSPDPQDRTYCTH